MSMRRSYYGVRQPRPLADEVARFIAMNGTPVRHQKRDLDNQCTICWDDLLGDYDIACPECAGSGYLVATAPSINLTRKKAYAPFAQPYGNAGNAGQFFKAGGQHTRYSAYLYFDLNHGKDVERGDRIIVKHTGLRQELVVMNNLPLMGGAIQIGWTTECSTASNIVLDEVASP